MCVFCIPWKTYLYGIYNYIDLVVGFQSWILHKVKLCCTDLVSSGQASVFSILSLKTMAFINSMGYEIRTRLFLSSWWSTFWISDKWLDRFVLKIFVVFLKYFCEVVWLSIYNVENVLGVDSNYMFVLVFRCRNFSFFSHFLEMMSYLLRSPKNIFPLNLVFVCWYRIFDLLKFTFNWSFWFWNCVAFCWTTNFYF